MNKERATDVFAEEEIQRGTRSLVKPSVGPRPRCRIPPSQENCWFTSPITQGIQSVHLGTTASSKSWIPRIRNTYHGKSTTPPSHVKGSHRPSL